ncbi:MAG: molybdopterin-binding protein, partial [Chloroflexi bacterium]|nr:molybdopterin-binding protein [Chloroflexota bacterium]
NIAGPDGRRALRKGRPLSAEDIGRLRELGRATVHVAELEAGDVGEDTAAGRLAEAVCGPGLRISGPSTGRANLLADVDGVLRVDVERLARLNGWEGITLATLPAHSAVREGRMVATVKILPYAVPEIHVRQAEGIAAEAGPIVRLDELRPRAVGLILSGSLSAEERIVRSFETALRQRLAALGSTIAEVAFVPLEDETGERELAETIGRQAAAGLELIILAGETAIMDRYDMAPRAVEQAGGEVTCFGAPVDPGNLLMLAYLGETPVMGAPGCARSPKTNIVDLLLPRLLVGDRLTRAEIMSYGHGGLLEDVPERPMPRSRLV